MPSLASITAPVAAELAAFEASLARAVLSDHPFLRPITRDLLRAGGKRMRPLLTLLTARLFGPITPRVQAAAVLIELIHWSTLVHDDVIDEAYLRRGAWTAGALMRSKSAVLVGDYLFSKGLSQATRDGCYGELASATRAIEALVAGELMQMEHACRIENDQATYTEIIRLKTGSLLGTAAECGALAAEVPAPQAEAMYRFGELLGLAFQIKDDLLDYGFSADGASLGKALCNDLKERKITLPMIAALRNASPQEQRKVRQQIRRAAESSAAIGWLRDFVLQNGGVDASLQALDTYRNQAVALLQAAPEGDARRSLEFFADYVVGRSH